MVGLGSMTGDACNGLGSVAGELRALASGPRSVLWELKHFDFV